MYTSFFQRYEKKYLLDPPQYEELMKDIVHTLKPDEYGAYTIFNLYFDTGAYDLARASARKPLYKEKLRLRSYGKAETGTQVFLELKKKFRGVVYKRRVRLPYNEAAEFLSGEKRRDDDQVLREIAEFISRYPELGAKVFLAYDRRAFTGRDDRGLRITFDTNVRFRQQELRLDSDSPGAPVLEPGKIIAEVKTPGAIPLWLCRALSRCGAYPVPFSKYGRCYTNFIRTNFIRADFIREGRNCASA